MSQISNHLLLPIILLAIMGVAVADPDGGVVTTSPREAPDAILHNPDMGWVLYENYPLDQDPRGSSTLLTLPKEDFPLVRHVALMFSWADVEKMPGVYDFSNINHAYDHWARRGKQIQLRLSSESLVWWNTRDPPSGQGVPDHVLALLPPDRKQVRRMEGIPYTVVDARDPAYLGRLDKFLAAVRNHFSADRPVTLIDLRGFGVWGEWHSGFQFPSIDARREALIKIIDHYARAFSEHHLSLSYSHDPDGPKALYAGPNNRYEESSTRNYAEFLHYSAFDHALTKANVTFRRDGVGGAVYSNQRRLCEQAFMTLSKGPMMSEFLGGYSQAKKGGRKWIEFMIDDALSLHPNYINLLGWQGADALAFCNERPDLLKKGLLKMGYRLVPTQIKYPATISSGEAFKVHTTWLNRATGRAMRGFHLSLHLFLDGKSIATANAGPFDTHTFVAGQAYSRTHTGTFKDVPPGDYHLHLQLLDPATNLPISLPLTGPSAVVTYPIGPVTIR